MFHEYTPAWPGAVADTQTPPLDTVHMTHLSNLSHVHVGCYLGPTQVFSLH